MLVDERIPLPTAQYSGRSKRGIGFKVGLLLRYGEAGMGTTDVWPLIGVRSQCGTSNLCAGGIAEVGLQSRHGTGADYFAAAQMLAMSEDEMVGGHCPETLPTFAVPRPPHFGRNEDYHRFLPGVATLDSQ